MYLLTGLVQSQENPWDVVARVVTQAIGGKVRGKRHGPEGSEVRITAQTNVSLLEHSLFELMKDEKYQTIHIFHVGLILQINSIRINVFKVCLRINSNKKIVDNLVK